MPTTALGQRLPQGSDPNAECTANSTPPTDGVAIAGLGTVFPDSTYVSAITGRTIGRRSRLEPMGKLIKIVAAIAAALWIDNNFHQPCDLGRAGLPEEVAPSPIPLTFHPTSHPSSVLPPPVAGSARTVIIPCFM